MLEPMLAAALAGPVESRSSAGEPMKRFARFVGLDVHRKTVVAWHSRSEFLIRGHRHRSVTSEVDH